MPECQMLPLYITRREHRHKRRRSGSVRHIWPPASFLAFHKAHYTDNFEPKFARGFNRLDGR